MNKDRVYDIAVIGAGPAGSFFAKKLAQMAPELKILIVDGQTEERSKVCGGLLAPDAQKLFAKTKLTLPKSVLADPQIFAVETIDLSLRYKRYYQRHYMNMDRLAFDRLLISLVPESVDVICARCEGIAETQDGYELCVRMNGENETIKACSVVGADGAGSVVRRSFFKMKMKQYVAIQQIFECQSSALPHYSCIFDRETSESCSWTIRKNDCFIFGGAFKKQGCREAFENQKKRLEEFLGYDLGPPKKEEACLLSSPSRFKDFVLGNKNGVFLIGEAAGLISASSFEGISSAILSGELLASAFADGKDNAKILKLYKKRALPLRLKLYSKIYKKRILCSPPLRAIIMKSGIKSVKVE